MNSLHSPVAYSSFILSNENVEFSLVSLLRQLYLSRAKKCNVDKVKIYLEFRYASNLAVTDKCHLKNPDSLTV